MTRRWAAVVIILVCLAALAALVWWRRSPRSQPLQPAPAPISRSAASDTKAPTATWPVHLYFPGRDGLLYAEARELEVTEDPQNRLRALVAGVLSGPHDSALVPALPADVQAQTVYLAPDGVAYVDLHSAERALPPPSGSQAEMATVYSLVDSIGLNLTAAKRVALLWNGTQLESFSGHLDTRHPLAPDTSLLARSQPASQ